MANDKKTLTTGFGMPVGMTQEQHVQATLK